MKESLLIQRVKETFGYPIVEVYTPDSTIEGFIDMGFDLLSSKVFKQTILTLPCEEIQVLNKEEIPLIVDVVPYVPSAAKRNPYIRDDFSIAEAQQYFNVQSQGILYPILATMTYNQLKNTFNGKFSWHYDRHTGTLYASHIPINASMLAVTAKTLYKKDDLPKELKTWLLNYVIAKTKITEGRIRSKYTEGSIGAVSDGDTLVGEGTAELAQREEELDNFVTLNVGVRR